MTQSEKGDDKASDSDIIQDYFEYVRQAGSRRRVESVQVLFAIGALGWYITNYPINTIPNKTPVRYLAALAAISGVFLVLKIGFLTIQYSLGSSKVTKLNEFVLPVLYFLSLFSVTVLTIIQIGVPENLQQEVVFILLFFIGIILIIYVLEKYQTYRDIRESKRNLREKGENISKKELMKTLELNRNIDSSYEIRKENEAYRPEGYKVEMDFVGATSQGEKVGITVIEDINTDTIANIRQTADRIDETPIDRFTIVTSNVTEEVADEVDRLNVDRLNVDIILI
ncbi:hypothetical protein [Haloarcula argentinensis]|uniref:Restriction endonuclease type IV Mrr domain-containing protein n=1 Tax=Haloarcula argentinensis TaxID=43776 RepID=A0ABU2F2C9_HALAR|nr:hypothetical protein [Haloarcula argentinensis]EMA20005.1 hypothetical protein C443_14252 [Haloarcula argentinensis DSM 12282]MDS0254717.1 hypothetical protein [Haloarcula argentinensis]